ncbi:MAG: transcription termination factor Rho [Calditrichaeota bacterium]|nr:MAG: transcription termination factor Rho [Calditrichota bacterium]
MKKISGYLEITPKGFGFLRSLDSHFLPSPEDIYVPMNLIRVHGLKNGSFVSGEAEVQEGSKKKPRLARVACINGIEQNKAQQHARFKRQTSINPTQRFNLALDGNDVTGHILNLYTPIGHGQRGLIIAPPKTGKTTILKHIAKAVTENHPQTKVFVLLVDERPEEVTDFRRGIPKATVLASSADESSTNHMRLTRMMMDVGVQWAEAGSDVVILVDSLTRMGRAYNQHAQSGGRTLSGGLAANALELPRKFFGTARNLEHGGSLTIIATILVDTGSRMDEVIFQEFKGTGNMDLALSVKCAERRIWPAIHINASGTRREDLLLSEEELQKEARVRSVIGGMNEVEAMSYILQKKLY